MQMLRSLGGEREKKTKKKEEKKITFNLNYQIFYRRRFKVEQTFRTLTYFQFHIWKFVEIGSIVDGTYFDWDRGRSFSDMFPVHATEERGEFKFFDTSLRA